METHVFDNCEESADIAGGGRQQAPVWTELGVAERQRDAATQWFLLPVPAYHHQNQTSLCVTSHEFQMRVCCIKLSNKSLEGSCFYSSFYCTAAWLEHLRGMC